MEEVAWEELELAIDSGASETVVGDGMLKTVEVKEGTAKKRGVHYEVADGTLLPNLGEQEFMAVGEEGMVRRMKAQVCDVNKALLSVRRVTQMGNKVVFEPGGGGGYIENESTGEQLRFKENGGMYALKMWIHKGGGTPSFGRQGR